MISTYKGNKSRFAGLSGVCKHAQKNFFDPRLSLVLPSIVTPLNGWVAPLDPWESQEEFTAVNIYGYEVFDCVTIISQNLIKPSRTSWNLLETGKIF